MIVSWNWLTDYLPLRLSVEKLAEKLAVSGLNHESTSEVGGDLAIDLEVTSNRPDCLCHIGVAREIAVVERLELKIPTPKPVEKGPEVLQAAGTEVLEPNLCPRFTTRVIQGAKVSKSPWWLRKRIETLGLRPINNIVDITNYVMFECGQPLHAYDLAKLSGRGLVVRKAQKGETLLAINNRKYELDAEMLVIADAEAPVGLAGVMGGLETEISDQTTEVLIEAAQFDPLSVRRTGRALGLSSDAAFRFERGLDPERTDWASRRTAQLILELAGGMLCKGAIDIGGQTRTRPEVGLRFERIAKILGIHVPQEEVRRILEALGLSITKSDSHMLSAVPPSWRFDLEREIDLIEEVGRVHGYERIDENRPVPMSIAVRAPRELVESEIRSTLTACGLSEAVTLSMVADQFAQPIDLEKNGSAEIIRVEHTTRKRETALRTSLVPSLLVRGPITNRMEGTMRSYSKSPMFTWPGMGRCCPTNQRESAWSRARSSAA